MTINPLERAVIAAARSFSRDRVPHLEERLHEAIGALEAWEATQDPEVREVGWHEVAEGDQLRSAKNGKFYPVLRVDSIRGGKKKITIQAGRDWTTVERPSPTEPSAFVKRGQAGAAVDMFVNVFSSGGK